MSTEQEKEIIRDLSAEVSLLAVELESKLSELRDYIDSPQASNLHSSLSEYVTLMGWR